MVRVDDDASCACNTITYFTDFELASLCIPASQFPIANTEKSFNGAETKAESVGSSREKDLTPVQAVMKKC
jgi:hypothetical protein